jgi:hypothetical protein
MEATFNLDRDVNALYNAANLGRFHRVLERGDPEEIRRVFYPVASTPGVDFYTTDSSRLKTRVAKRAHKANPVEISIGAYSGGSYYAPESKLIVVSLSRPALRALHDANYSLKELKRFVGHQYDFLIREFDAEGLKGTIYHELTHWVSDSLHNRHIAKLINVAKDARGSEVLRRWRPSVGQTPMEIDAQVHAVKAIRQTMGKKDFDKITWEDLFKRKISILFNFGVTPRGILPEKEWQKYFKIFVKRLHREGLIGKRMRDIPSYSDMKLWFFRFNK